MKIIKPLACFSILFLLASTGFASARTTRKLTRITKKLPPVDTVMVFKFKMKNGQDYNIESTEASVIFKGQEAQNIASLWRSQDWYESAAACHYPGYGMQFLSKGKVITFATVCLTCTNISFEKPLIGRWQSVNWESRRGKRLLRFFPKVFGDKYKEAEQ